jgi:hypothetical protein
LVEIGLQQSERRGLGGVFKACDELENAGEVDAAIQFEAQTSRNSNPVQTSLALISLVPTLHFDTQPADRDRHLSLANLRASASPDFQGARQSNFVTVEGDYLSPSCEK